MVTLPDDEEGRSWVQGQWNENPNVENVIATLVTMGEDDEIIILGNAFVIRDNGDSAICLGAAHSFDKVKRLQQMRTAARWFNLPRELRPFGPEYISQDQTWAAVFRDGKPTVCQIIQMNYIEDYDVVVFIIKSPESSDLFKSRVAVDLSVPRVGDEVAIIAQNMRIATQEAGSSIIEQNLDLRLGVVTHIIMGPSGLPGQSCIFRTTIPATPGMSGAPVFSKLVAGKPMVVRGVVSSDSSPSEAFTNFLIPGDSAVSMLWPAMGLGLEVSTPDSSGFAFLADLLHERVFDDRSDRVKVLVHRQDEKTEVLYVDERETPASKVLLTTTGHPNIGQQRAK